MEPVPHPATGESEPFSQEFPALSPGGGNDCLPQTRNSEKMPSGTSGKHQNGIMTMWIVSLMEVSEYKPCPYLVFLGLLLGADVSGVENR